VGSTQRQREVNPRNRNLLEPLWARRRSMLVRWRLRRPGLIAEAAQPTYTLDLVPPYKRVLPLRPEAAPAACRPYERLPRAMNEIWYQGSETPRSGRRVTRVVGQAARGALEHAPAPPLSSTLCALPAQAIDAAQGQPGREGRRWHHLCQLEEELGQITRWLR
jgi:hypothetical protein